MEAGTMHSQVYQFISECTFDRIDSPQYLNFNDYIPEAKDSYFERKVEDDPAEQQDSKRLQTLPLDSENESTELEVKPEPAVKNDTREDKTLLNDSGDDLIQAVKTLQVNQPLEIKAKEIVTSTPFRVKGVQPMQWRPADAKLEGKKYTKTRPFSFEERNKQTLQRKAQRIQTLIQAEKEARKFRANPVPKFLRKTTSNNNPPPQETSNAVINKNKSTETGVGQMRFKAKSPKVLRRPAFQPNLPRQPLLPPQPFALSSELRAKDRKIFDNYIKDKERLDERLRQLREAAQKRREEEEVMKMRKEMVIKAQPVRKFKFVTTPVSKRPLTEPMTPTVAKRQRR